jgi:hypothetical protein
MKMMISILMHMTTYKWPCSAPGLAHQMGTYLARPSYTQLPIPDPLPNQDRAVEDHQTMEP